MNKIDLEDAVCSLLGKYFRVNHGDELTFQEALDLVGSMGENLIIDLEDSIRFIKVLNDRRKDD